MFSKVIQASQAVAKFETFFYNKVRTGAWQEKTDLNSDEASEQSHLSVLKCFRATVVKMKCETVAYSISSVCTYCI